MTETEQTESRGAQGATSAAERRAAKEQVGQHEPRFSRERLLGPDGPKITGHKRRVIAGALHGDDTEEFTRAQAKRRIEGWLTREVEQEVAS